MTTHGLLSTILEDHPTYRRVNGEWKSFKYVEPFSRYNKAKHWVDDINNRRHDPIGLEDVWATKWWPTRQFTFLCSVSEVNAVNSRARARKEAAEDQLTFRRNLAKQMLQNRISDDGDVAHTPIRARRQSGGLHSREHEMMTRPNFTGGWDLEGRKFRRVKTKYCKTACASCSQLCRTYCSCNKQVSMCLKCWGEHKAEHYSTFRSILISR